MRKVLWIIELYLFRRLLLALLGSHLVRAEQRVEDEWQEVNPARRLSPSCLSLPSLRLISVAHSTGSFLVSARTLALLLLTYTSSSLQLVFTHGKLTPLSRLQLSFSLQSRSLARS